MQSYISQTGAVIAELGISISIVTVLFLTSLDINNFLTDQNTVNDVVLNSSEIVRNNSGYPDRNDLIKIINIDLHNFINYYFTTNNKSPEDYTVRTAMFASLLPETEQPISFLWMGVKSNQQNVLTEFFPSMIPCTSLVMPINLDHVLPLSFSDSTLLNEDEVLLSKEDLENIAYECTETELTSGEYECTSKYSWLDYTDSKIQGFMEGFC